MGAGGHRPNYKFRHCHAPALDLHILVSTAPLSQLPQSIVSPILGKTVATSICNEHVAMLIDLTAGCIPCQKQ
jgi:hypothetical protein